MIIKTVGIATTANMLRQTRHMRRRVATPTPDVHNRVVDCRIETNLST